MVGIGTHHSALALLLALQVLCAACALPAAPYTPSKTPQEQTETWRPQVQIVEGQPRGLLLELSLPQGAPEDITALALLRRVDDPDLDIQTDFELHYTFDRQQDSPLWQKTAKVAFMDAGLKPGVTYHYLVAVESAQTLYSKAIWMRWEEPPAPPKDVKATATGQHAALEWSPAPDLGAIVFRRQVGVQGYARLPHMGEPGEPLYVDVPPTSGVLYAYRVSMVRFVNEHPIIGPPSAEIYVKSTPDGPLVKPIGPAPEPPQDP